MKKNIAILGSTGSIGKSLINIIDKNKKDFTIKLLTANKDHEKLFKQAKKFKVKNLIITNKNSYKILKKKIKNSDINIYNDFNSLNKIFKKKTDYVMSSITGINGLLPTFKCIKFTKKIAIANKEAIICGWNLIRKELKKNNTDFIPVDSEHFSIWYGLKNNNDQIKKIYLTASGGPFIHLPINKFSDINIKDALKHPNWKMGKKITIDSATLMNKVFEIIEAKKIFNLKYNQLSILTHPNSYIHSIIQFRNGIIKLIAHDTDMKIPILNTLNINKRNSINYETEVNISSLNNLDFQKPNSKKFPLIKLVKKFPEKSSLFETVIVAANDELVKKFLNKRIKFIDISNMLLKLSQKKEFLSFKNKTPKKIEDIIKLANYVRLKISLMSV